ncbi:PA14 domain-containing protein [Catenovulum sp. 2E275]|uniref:glycoside hydrolase n=1 Tax=Catenovulum sp. 2E275 TaxID=2980497 RepID=UPI0021D1C90C|nr:glycoside hydrolase [Catenovulum sp. 2E275]MCU4677394.1 PA14 domain-containing protein [Catenovulum sp. 2E275]
MQKIFTVGAIASTLLLMNSTQVIAANSVNVNFDKTYQTIDGFGASDAWTFDPMIRKWVSEGKEQAIEDLANTLFSTDVGIGLSAWRFNIGAGSAEQGSASGIQLDDLGRPYRRAELLQPAAGAAIDTSKQTGQIRFMQEAAERGVTDLIAFVNSPPVWATKNGLAHPDSSVGSTNLKDDMVDEFATFMVDVLKYLRNDQGIPINYISPINEPTWDWQGNSQEGNRYNNQELKAVYNTLYDELVTAQLANDVVIEAGETVEYAAALSDSYHQSFNSSTYNGGMNSRGVGSYKNYIDELLGSNGIRDKIGNKISLHGYFSDAWSDRMGKLRDLVWENVQAASPGAKVWMSEVCILGGTGDVRDFEGGGFDVLDIKYALHVGKMLHRDLSRMNASAWHWWLGVTPYDYKDGLLKINSALEADSLQSSKVLWTLGQYSRFIRPDYKRIDLPSVDNLSGVMASAYKNPTDDKVVIVAVNAGTSSDTLNIKVQNLPAGKTIKTFSVYQTNATDNLAQKPAVSADSEFTITAETIVTLVGEVVDNDQAPNAGFEQDKKKLVSGDSVTFQDLSTNSPDTYEWLFEGGTPQTSTEVMPTVLYSEAGSFDVTLKVTNAFGTTTLLSEDAVEVFSSQTSECNSDGYVTSERWNNVEAQGDYTFDSSVASVPFDTAADEISTLSLFEIAPDSADGYGTRISGYICAPQTGNYTFWIAADNDGELWLSDSESPNDITKIAEVSGWTNYREWDKLDSQQSQQVFLVAGQKYYIESRHKENDGGDNLSVGWQLPDNTLERPIPSQYLNAYLDHGNQQPQQPEPSEPDNSGDTSKPNKSGGAIGLWVICLLLSFRLFSRR